MKRLIAFVALTLVFGGSAAIVGRAAYDLGSPYGEIGSMIAILMAIAILAIEIMCLVWCRDALMDKDRLGGVLAVAALIVLAPLVAMLDMTFWSTGLSDRRAQRAALNQPNVAKEYVLKQFSATPDHRPREAVAIDLDAHKARYRGINDKWARAKKRWMRRAHQKWTALRKELAYAKSSERNLSKLEFKTAVVVGEADPLAATLARQFGGDETKWSDYRLFHLALALFLARILASYFGFKRPRKSPNGDKNQVPKNEPEIEDELPPKTVVMGGNVIPLPKRRNIPKEVAEFVETLDKSKRYKFDALRQHFEDRYGFTDKYAPNNFARALRTHKLIKRGKGKRSYYQFRQKREAKRQQRAA